MKHLRTWLLSLFDRTVAEQQAEIRSLKCELANADKREAGWAKTQSAVNQTCREVMAERDTAERLLNAVGKAIDFAPIDQVWRDSPAAAMHAVGAHVEQLKAVESRRADAAESTANDLRAEIRDLQRQLDAEKHAHEVTRAEKRCTDTENRLLAKIHEGDIARRDAERAIQIRRQAEAETATDALRAEDRE